MKVRTDKQSLADTFYKNVQLLPLPLQQRLGAVDLDEVLRTCEVTNSEEGHPVCRMKQGDNWVRVTSIDPITQAERWCDTIPFDNISTLFIYGCGFGYPLQELEKRKQQNTIVVVFEQNIHLFIATLHYFDLEPLMRDRKFAFYVGEYEQFSNEFMTLVNSFIFFYCTAPAVAFTPASRLARPSYVRIHQKVLDTLAVNVNYYGNSHYDNMLGFHQLIDNIDEVAENPYLSSLKDKYRGVPAIIVANGPSLDKNVQELKKAKGKALIICCESAIKPLLKNGIVPDALCVLERDPEVYLYHFKENEYPEDMALLALSLVDPRIFPSFRGPKVPIFRSRESNSKWMNTVVGDGVGLFGGTSVAHLAFEAAVFMGAGPVVLVGQDLAYGRDGITHSRDSIYAEDKLKDTVSVIQSRPVLYVESNEGQPIKTNWLWLHFKQVFEQMIRENPQLTVINATEGGARIEGTTCDKLAHVIEWYCRDELPYNLHELIVEQKQAIDQAERKEKIRGFMQSLDVYASVYRALTTVTADRRDESLKLLESSEQDEVSAVLPALLRGFKESFDEMMTFLRNDLHGIFFQQVLLVAFHAFNETGGRATPAKIKRGLQIQYELFDQLHVICQSLVRNFQIAREKLAAKGYGA